ncbi:hypothetical protein ACYSNM_08060 [Myroides sp. LJL116]
MKKAAKYLVIGVVLLVIALFVGYKYRQSQAKNQLVDPQATSILAIAVDDMVWNNLSTLLLDSEKSDSTSSDAKEWADYLWKTPGVSIPSKLYMFTKETSPYGFYGILKVKNYDNCFSYFATDHDQEMEFLDKEKSVVSLRVNPYTSIVFNQEYLVYSISADKNITDLDLLQILQSKDSWVKIKDLNTFYTQMPVGDISFLNADKTLSIAADVKDNTLSFVIDRDLGRLLETQLWKRQFKKDNLALWFTYSMDLEFIPGIYPLVSDLLGLEQPTLINYMDVSVAKDLALVTTTKVVMDYDQDFNQVESTVEYTQEVPWLTYSFLQEDVTSEVLQKTLSPGFELIEENDFVVASAKLGDNLSLEKVETISPLQGYIDFANLPAFTKDEVIADLQKNNVVVEFSSETTSLTSIKVWGKISWKNRN